MTDVIYPDITDTAATYQVTIAPYNRPFRQPLNTSHGIWRRRQGAIVTLRSATNAIGQGEIAPLPWFGSETPSIALEFCQSLGGGITTAEIFAIPDRLPCCQFAFETAFAALQTDAPVGGNWQSSSMPDRITPSQIAALLPTGAAAITQWPTSYAQGHRTFKWKIGVAPIAAELSWFQQLHQQLPQNCTLRLDANAGLSVADSERWLAYCEEYPVEYLEQPLGTHQFDTMKSLSAQYSTPIALDESIASLRQIQACHSQGWPGIYVIKPAIIGSPQRLTQFMQQQPINAVFSSVFETEVGYAAALRLAQSLQPDDRAFGFGTKEWW